MCQRHFFLILSLLLTFFAARDAVSQTQQFGRAVALSGTTALIGEPINHFGSPRVYVYERESGAWVVTDTLTSGETGDRFGQAIAFDGTRALIGALGHDAAYIFRREASGEWVEEARLSPPSEGVAFGAAVALEGDRALVGAYLEDGGAAYLFHRDAGGTWTEEARLTGSDSQSGDQFGYALTLDRDEAFIGARRYADRQGAVYVFRDQNGSWTEHQKLTASDGAPSDHFGHALAAEEGRLLVGAYVHNDEAGAAYVFEKDNAGEWLEKATITPSETQAGFFGYAIALNGNDLWISSLQGTDNFGLVTTFRDDGTGQWIPQQELPGDGGNYGWSIAFDGLHGVVGAFGSDFGLGEVRTFQLGTGDVWMEAQDALFSMSLNFAAITGSRVACGGGTAAGFGCRNADLLSLVSLSFVNAPRGIESNDVWGWVDPATRREYALLGLDDGTAFIDVTDPVNPVHLGTLPRTPGSAVQTWRDIKVYADHALVVADAVGQHGMQVFDLTRLRDVTNPPVTFDVDALYSAFGSAHNVVVNEQTGFAYAVGASSGGQTCGGGLHMIDVHDPKNPQFAGCFQSSVGRGYTHDAQCVLYHGPDPDYQGREICLGADEDGIAVSDVTDKSAPREIATATYPTARYVHQGWFTEDQRYFFQDDELDEFGGVVDRTRTIVWDLTDLDSPVLLTEYLGPTGSIDHNQYVRKNFVFQANYTSGLRILDISDVANPVEIAFFDTVPSTDIPVFGGAWSVYPFLPSGNLLISSSEAGLFIVDATGIIVDTESAEVPQGFALSEAYPNPFHPQTTLELTLPSAERVSVAAFDLLGRRVATLHDGLMPAGTHVLVFDATGLPSGTYFIRADAGGRQRQRVVTLVK